MTENPDEKSPKKSKSDNLKDIKLKIAISSGKGGVGKSTVALNLARAFARKFKGENVALLDCDF